MLFFATHCSCDEATTLFIMTLPMVNVPFTSSHIPYFAVPEALLALVLLFSLLAGTPS
jgi:hypothetical protein